MGPQTLLLLTGLGAQHLRADHQVSQWARLITHGWRRKLGHRERQHVGGFVAPAEPRIEAAALGRANHRNADFATDRASTEGRAGPDSEVAARRRPGPYAPTNINTDTAASTDTTASANACVNTDARASASRFPCWDGSTHDELLWAS